MKMEGPDEEEEEDPDMKEDPDDEADHDRTPDGKATAAVLTSSAYTLISQLTHGLTVSPPVPPHDKKVSSITL